MSAINGPGIPKPSPWLSPAILSGSTLYISGQCGVDPVSGEFLKGTVQDRTAQALKNVEATLRAAGMGLENIVATTIYLSNYKRDFNDMNQAYIAGLSKTDKPLPSRTCIGVANLPKDTDVEITVIAAKEPKAKL
ncbi:hypothetical protein JCM8097_006451 [Rhodosporidiobolus ruineniae]